jgi:hypothetical protein
VEIGRSGGEGRGIVQCKEIRGGERKETGKEKEKKRKKGNILSVFKIVIHKLC